MIENEFNQLVEKGYNRIPVVLETFADLDTPLSIYLKLANLPYTYLLESVQDGSHFGRYSFVGLPATSRIEARGNHIRMVDKNRVEERIVDDTLAFISDYLSNFNVAPFKELPCGGLAGYFRMTPYAISNIN